MLFLEFGLGMIVWIGAITILHRNADHKKLKTELINFSPAILYGLLATSYVTPLVANSGEGILFLSAGILLAVKDIVILSLMGIVILPWHVGNFLFSLIGISQLHETNLFVAPFALHLGI